MIKPMKSFVMGAILLLSFPLCSQNYSYKATLNGDSLSGFYSILLSPEITSKLQPNFSDLRLYDSNATEIPYLLNQEKRVVEGELFVEYPIIEQTHNNKLHYSRLVIRNSKKTAINNIVLKIKSADVRKVLKLNAGNDNKTWFVLKDEYYYNSISSSESQSEIRVLNFPLSDYEYYELLIEDFNDKPINITEAGYYKHASEEGKYTEIQNISYSKSDTLKETLIAISTHGHYIDKIAFDIEAPRYYLREADLFCNRVEKNKKKIIHYQSTITSFDLISNSQNTLYLDNLKEDTIYVRIKNNDNAPLKISKIKLFELNKYLTAELTSNQEYYLLFSDKEADAANYDLKYFATTIPNNLKILSPNTPEKISSQNQIKKSNNIAIKNYWLWISITLVAILLSFMSFKMVKDANNKQL